jgi:hypothetical protein
MMSIEVKRELFSSASSVGSMLVDGVFQCFTLEPTHREVDGEPVDGWKIQGKTAIPAGSYDVILRMSARFKRMMPHVEGVPGFQEVEIHWGNYPSDTEGCTLVGLSRSADFVGHSREAFDALFGKIQAAVDAGQQVRITYEGTAPQ